MPIKNKNIKSTMMQLNPANIQLQSYTKKKGTKKDSENIKNQYDQFRSYLGNIFGLDR
jgi:hypothetical protein